MISRRTRILLDRHALAGTALGWEPGERLAQEAGQSVEFHDFREYRAGDELRYVDWRAYARTGRLYTRLHRAERSLRLHLLLDPSASMMLGGKAEFSAELARQLAYLAQREAVVQVHDLAGRHSRAAAGVGGLKEAWDFIGSVTTAPAEAVTPVDGLMQFAATAGVTSGRALAVVLSDLLDPAPLRPALTALRSRGFDVSFLQLLATADLNPDEGLLDLRDSESGERLLAGPAEVRAYRSAVRAFTGRIRSAVLRAGYRHLLLEVPDAAAADPERDVILALLRNGIITRR